MKHPIPADFANRIKQLRADAGDPEVVRLVTEGYRLSYGHQVNPTYAIETSQIQPLPHQRIAVYERMLWQPRMSSLLADDAGVGKTSMGGVRRRA